MNQVPVPTQPPAGRELVRQDQPLPRRPLAPTDQFRRLLMVLRRRWLPFVAVFLIVLAAAGAYIVQRVPQYTATATLLVNSRVLNVQAKNDDVVPTLPAVDEAIASEIEVLRSAGVTRRVIDAVQQRRADFGRIVTQSETQPPARAVLASTEGRLKVDRPGGTNVLGVSFTAADPEIAALAANEFVTQYLAVKVDSRLNAARTADVGLRQELDNLRGRVVQAEAQVASYRRSRNLLSANGETLTEQEQSVYKQQEAGAQTQLAEETARLSTARSQLARGSTGDDVGEALSSPVVNQLRGQRAQASAKLAQLEARYQPQHPEVVRARDELAKVDGEIQAEIRRVMSNLEARVQVARRRAGAASGIAAASRGELAANTSASVELNELERRADALRTNYNTLLQRQTIIASQAVVADADARPLSPALPPEQPSSPNRQLNAVLALAIALLAAGSTVVVLQLFDQTLVSSREAEEALGLRHVVNVPAVASIADASDKGMAPIDYVVERPLSPLAEAMRSLLFAIENEGRNVGMFVVGITSARAGEGKSTTAACLARIAAISGRRTLLIDGDIRRPSIAGIFGLSPTVGLTEVLSEQAQVRDALLRDERSGAYILPSLTQKVEHRHINSEHNLHRLMERIGQVFDIVIIDTAPSLAAVESRLLMNFVDQAFMVVRWKHTPVPIIRSALRRLAAVRIRVSGIIMTQVNMKAVAAYAIDDVDHEYKSYGYPTD